MSEKKRKIFRGQFKAKVALEAIQAVKTVNEIAQEVYLTASGGGASKIQ